MDYFFCVFAFCFNKAHKNKGNCILLTLVYHSTWFNCLSALRALWCLFLAILSMLALSSLLRALSCDSTEGSGFSYKLSLIKARIFSKASAKFNCCDLVTSERKTRCPSFVNFEPTCKNFNWFISIWKKACNNPTFSKSFALTLSLNQLAESKWNRTSTLVLTLFTFCPPGPELRL